MASKCKRKDQKRFQNVVIDPLITGDPDDLILGLVALGTSHHDWYKISKLICFYVFQNRCPGQSP